MKDKIRYTYTYGFLEKENPGRTKIVGSADLYEDKLVPSTTIKKIKMWFGSPPGKSDLKSLLGIQVLYINYVTGEKKDTNYQGSSIEGMDFEVKELEVKD